MSSPPIKVLLVDDSPIAHRILGGIFASSPEVELVGVAHNGREALDMLADVQPDVICTDLHMPVMDGLALTRAVMSTHPLPILVLSVSVREDDVRTVFELLEAGAVDVFPKPAGGVDIDPGPFATALIARIKVVAGVRAIRRPARETEPVLPEDFFSSDGGPLKPRGIVVIGASTGGPAAFRTVLSRFPADFSLPIVCVQHIAEGFIQGLVDWLDQGCPIKVRKAHAGETPVPGTAYFAQDRKHLSFAPDGRLECVSSNPVDGHCPSITVTFRSAAQVYGRGTIGALLTGMGSDGAEGLLAIRKVGGITVAQDEASCVVYGMPKAAADRGAAQAVLPLGRIPAYIQDRAQSIQDRS